MYSQSFYVNVAITPDLQLEFRWTGKNKCSHVKITQQELQDLKLCHQFYFSNLSKFEELRS